MKIIAHFALALITAASISAPAFAQKQEGLVNVNLGDVVLQDIASDIDVDVSDNKPPIRPHQIVK